MDEVTVFRSVKEMVLVAIVGELVGGSELVGAKVGKIDGDSVG